jgi:hypothetical protein
MKTRYRLFLRRKSVYYAFDDTTKSMLSLQALSQRICLRLKKHCRVLKQKARRICGLNLDSVSAAAIQSASNIRRKSWSPCSENVLMILNASKINEITSAISAKNKFRLFEVASRARSK